MIDFHASSSYYVFRNYDILFYCVHVNISYHIGLSELK